MKMLIVLCKLLILAMVLELGNAITIDDGLVTGNEHPKFMHTTDSVLSKSEVSGDTMERLLRCNRRFTPGRCYEALSTVWTFNAENDICEVRLGCRTPSSSNRFPSKIRCMMQCEKLISKLIYLPPVQYLKIEKEKVPVATANITDYNNNGTNAWNDADIDESIEITYDEDVDEDSSVVDGVIQLITKRPKIFIDGMVNMPEIKYYDVGRRMADEDYIETEERSETTVKPKWHYNLAHHLVPDIDDIERPF